MAGVGQMQQCEGGSQRRDMFEILAHFQGVICTELKQRERERENGFRLFLFVLRFLRYETFFSHFTPLCGYIGTDSQIIDLPGYRISAWAFNQISPHKTQNICVADSRKA